MIYVLKILHNIVVWKKPDNSYYYRTYKHYFLRFDVGYYNQYGHEVILIINDLDFSYKKKYSKERIKRKIINAIEKI